MVKLWVQFKVLQKNHYKTDGSWMRMRNIDTQNTCLLLLQTQTFIKTPIDQSASRFTYYYAHTSHKKNNVRLRETSAASTHTLQQHAVPLR